VVEKTCAKGRVVSIATRVVLSPMAAVIAALRMSKVSRTITTSLCVFSERDGPASQHEKGPQDVPLQQGVAVSRVGDLPDDVRLHLLLAGEDVAGDG
jgi:hypothetical protein